MSRRSWECSINVWPHQVTVWCDEDDIRDEVARKLKGKFDATDEDLAALEIEDTIDLSQLRADDDAVSEHYDNQGADNG